MHSSDTKTKKKKHFGHIDNLIVILDVHQTLISKKGKKIQSLRERIPLGEQNFYLVKFLAMHLLNLYCCNFTLKKLNLGVEQNFRVFIHFTYVFILTITLLHLPSKLCFWKCLFVCGFVFQQHNSKCYGQILG